MMMINLKIIIINGASTWNITFYRASTWYTVIFRASTLKIRICQVDTLHPGEYEKYIFLLSHPSQESMTMYFSYSPGPTGRV